MSMSEKKKKRLLTGIIVLTVLVMGLITWFVGKPLIGSSRTPTASGPGWTATESGDGFCMWAW